MVAIPGSHLPLDPAALAAVCCMFEQYHRTEWSLSRGDEVVEDMQKRWFAWYESNRRRIEFLPRDRSCLSSSTDELGAFLTLHGINTPFGELTDGMGIATVTDVWMECLAPAIPCEMPVFSKSYGSQASGHVRAFEVQQGGYEIYTVPGYKTDGYYDRLVRLYLKDGSSAWLMMIDSPGDQLAVVETASDVLSKCKPSFGYSGVFVPVLQFEETASLDWLVGVSRGNTMIERALQVVRWHTGDARAKWADRGLTENPLLINRPFLLFLTQPGSDIPVGATYVTPERWMSSDGATCLGLHP